MTSLIILLVEETGCWCSHWHLLYASDHPPSPDHCSLPQEKHHMFDHPHAKKLILLITLDKIRFMGKSLMSCFASLALGSKHWCKMSQQQTFLSTETHPDKFRKMSPCLEGRLLMPLKILPYGVPSHTFLDYFQKSASFWSEACKKFDTAIKICYGDEFLHLPTSQDMHSIVKLHKEKHNFDGMFGSLDCSHTYWKNCPKAWHGAYKGKENRPFLILEVIADYHIFLACILQVCRVIKWSQCLEPFTIFSQSYKWSVWKSWEGSMCCAIFDWKWCAGRWHTTKSVMICEEKKQSIQRTQFTPNCRRVQGRTWNSDVENWWYHQQGYRLFDIA